LQEQQEVLGNHVIIQYSLLQLNDKAIDNKTKSATYWTLPMANMHYFLPLSPRLTTT